MLEETRYHSGMLPRLIGLVLVLALCACSLIHPHFEQPTVRVVGVELRGGNLLQQNFAVKLNVQNPNSQALPVRELTFSLKVEGVDFASGLSEQAFSVPALGNADFDMNISANLAFAMMTLASKRQQHADALAYELSGTARIDLPFTRQIEFHQNGSLPLADFFKYLN
jgi:LEA14-like dessication related protein